MPSSPRDPDGILLALGGGSARGLAHIGVIRVLEEAGLRICGVAGTSIGAIVGGFYAAGKLDQYEILMRAMGGQSVLWFLDPVIPTTGFFEGARVDALHRAALGEVRIEELSMPYSAVAADLESGEEVRVRRGVLADAMRASLAIPGIFHPHRLGGRWMVDGGMVAPIPIGAAQELGSLPVVAVNLQTHLLPRHHDPPTDSAHHPLHIPDPATRERLARAAENEELDPELRDFLRETMRMGQAATMRLVRRTERLWRRFKARTDDEVPGLFTAVNDGFAMMQTRLADAQVRLESPDVVLVPKLPGVGLFDFGRAAEIIAEGERVAREALDRGALDRIRGGDRGLRGRLRRWREARVL